MKKKTLFASAIALATGALIGAVSPAPTPTTESGSRHELAADKANTPSKGQSGGGMAGSIRQTARDIEEFGKALAYSPMSGNGRVGFGRQTKWCSMATAGRPNKIKRSRRTKRKHRRS